MGVRSIWKVEQVMNRGEPKMTGESSKTILRRGRLTAKSDMA